MTITEMAELLIEVSPELREAYTQADIELALDDRGWLVTKSYMSPETDKQTRQILVGKSRLYWAKDPLCKQAVRLWTDYSMGDGIEWKSDDAGVSSKIKKFMKDRRNRRLLSSAGQRKSSKKMLVDGEVFFAIFIDDTDGSKVIRRVDPIQVTDIVTDPEDSEHILAYRRQLPAKPGEATTRAIYYADWTADEADRTLAEQQKIQGINEPIKLQTGVVMYHAPFDDLEKRGNGLLFASIDWTKEHRKFMEARVAITAALAKYAYKLSVKGGQGAIDAVKSKLQSTYAGSAANTVERNPKNAPAGTFVRNDGIDIEAVPKASGAGDAKDDGNQLKLMHCAGTGIMLHYYGDPSTGNLATASAMELPMLKQFKSYQKHWKDVYMDIFTIVCDDNSGDGIDEQMDDLPVTIDMPPILEADLQKLGSALQAIAGLWPEIAESDEVLMGVLTDMEIDEPEDVLKQLREVRKQQKAEQDKKDALMIKAMGSSAAPGAKQITNKEAEALAAALVRVAEVMEQ